MRAWKQACLIGLHGLLWVRYVAARGLSGLATPCAARLTDGAPDQAEGPPALGAQHPAVLVAQAALDGSEHRLAEHLRMGGRGEHRTRDAVEYALGTDVRGKEF